MRWQLSIIPAPIQHSSSSQQNIHNYNRRRRIGKKNKSSDGSRGGSCGFDTSINADIEPKPATAVEVDEVMTSAVILEEAPPSAPQPVVPSSFPWQA